jgi:maleate isomerase
MNKLKEERTEIIRIPVVPNVKQSMRIGLLALSTDPTIERDFRQIINTEEVEFFVSRIAYGNSDTAENYRAMAFELTKATELILPGGDLDVVAYGCTSATVEIGVKTIFEQIRIARPGIACTTPMTAVCKGLNQLGIKRISLLTPYGDEVNHSIRKYLDSQGISAINIASFYLDTDEEKLQVSPAAICKAACEIDRDDVEAIFISCTALRAAEAIASIESQLHKPVLSSNQALIWEALRLGGYNKPIFGYGYLLQI